MRVAILGIVLAAGLAGVIAGACIGRSEVYGQDQPVNKRATRAMGDGLIALSADAGQGREQITLVDPKAHVMAVYHIDRNTGEISLKSVRNVHWDLQMDEYNGVRPSPRDIRALLQQR